MDCQAAAFVDGGACQVGACGASSPAASRHVPSTRRSARPRASRMHRVLADVPWVEVHDLGQLGDGGVAPLLEQ